MRTDERACKGEKVLLPITRCRPRVNERASQAKAVLWTLWHSGTMGGPFRNARGPRAPHSKVYNIGSAGRLFRSSTTSLTSLTPLVRPTSSQRCSPSLLSCLFLRSLPPRLSESLPSGTQVSSSRPTETASACRCPATSTPHSPMAPVFTRLTVPSQPPGTSTPGRVPSLPTTSRSSPSTLAPTQAIMAPSK